MNIKRGNAMANSNDTPHPENGQHTFSNLFSVLKQYRFNISPNNLPEIKSHFEELQSSIISGIGAMGSLMFWATESSDYEFEQLKNDIRDIGYLLIHLRTISDFTANEINRMNAQSHKEGGEEHA